MSEASVSVSSRIPSTGWRGVVQWARGFRDDALALTRQIHSTHGPVVQQGGILRTVSLFGPDANRMLLLDRDKLFSAKRSWELIMGRIFGGGLLLRDGEDHRHHRKIMQEAFKTHALESYCERMNPAIADGIADWGSESGTFYAFPAFKHLTLNLAAEIFLGEKLGPEVTQLNRSFEATVAASMSILRLPIPGLEFHAGLKGREHMSHFFRDLIPQKRAGEGSDLFSRLFIDFFFC